MAEAAAAAAVRQLMMPPFAAVRNLNAAMLPEEHVDHLDLKNQRFFHIEENTFAEHNHYLTIDLSDNLIGQIGNEVFARCQHLKELNLNGNLIARIGFEQLSRLPVLEKFDLGQNLVNGLDREFIRSESLHVLDLSRNAIAAIDERAFSQLVNIQVLNLSWNRIERLRSLTFARNEHLKRLELDHNRLTELDPVHCRGLIDLEVLTLHANQIRTVHKDAFRANIALKSLNLEENAVNDYDIGQFEQCRDLTSLRIDASVRLCCEMFANLDRLETIHLRITGRDTFSVQYHFQAQRFARMVRLREFKLVVRYLQMSRNAVFAFPPSLVAFHLESTGGILPSNDNDLNIFRFQAQLQALPNLTKLTITIGKLRRHMLRMERFWRWQRQAFATRLKSLRLNNVQVLSQILISFDLQFANLRFLDLSYSRVALHLQNAFEHLVKLQYLLLVGIRIDHISIKLFEHNVRLIYLNLEQCSIQRIEPYAFYRLRRLKFLNLKRNFLSDEDRPSYGLDRWQTRVQYE